MKCEICNTDKAKMPNPKKVAPMTLITFKEEICLDCWNDCLREKIRQTEELISKIEAEQKETRH